MALSDMTVAELRDLANKTHVQLGTLTLKADIIEAIEAAGVSVEEPGDEEPESEPQAEVEAEPVSEEEAYEEYADLDLSKDEPEPVVQAGGYVATDKGWELKESLED